MRSFKSLSLLVALLLILTTFSGCSGTAAITSGGIVINEIVTSNAHSYSSSGFGTPDWIELYNGTDADVTLTDWILRRTGSAEKTYTFPEATVKAGEYLIVCACEGVDGTGELYTNYKLPKEGCGLVLQNADGITKAEVVVPELSTDMSYALTDGGYKYCLTPTPGAKNEGSMSDTREGLVSDAPAGLVLNEATRTWIEVYNSTDKPIALQYFYLSDDVGDPLKWRFPEMEIAAGAYLVVRTDAVGELCTDFTIGSSESTVCLSAVTEVRDTLVLPNKLSSISAGKTDGGGTAFFLQPTPGAKNEGETTDTADFAVTPMGTDAPVHINELMLKNESSLIDEDGDRSDWVELYNSSSETINLSRYAMSDDTDQPDKWRLPDVDLEAGGYAVIYLSGKNKDKHSSFRVGAGESLVLFDMQKMQEEHVYFDDNCRLSNVSYGLKDGKWLYFGSSTPGKANTTMGYESITNVDKLDKSGIWVSEVSATAAARSGKLDWVELHNAGTEDVSLDGWTLGGSANDPYNYKLSGTIGGGEYKVIYCSSSTSEQKSGVATFGISSSGAEIILADEAGGIKDDFVTGTLRPSVSSGRATGDFSGERYFFSTPTPGAANGAGVSGYSEQPVFSREAGFISEKSITVEISGGGTIYYTTDGSFPTAASSIYSSPLTIDKSTVLKAASIENGKLISETTAATYLFEKKHTLPVVCMSIAPSDLSYINSSSSRKDVKERESFIEYFEPDGTLGVSFAAGTSIGGNSTRTYAQKTYNLYMRGAYGQSSVVYPFFEDYPITEFQCLTLRNAGQNGNYSRMADCYANMLVRDMDLDYAETRFVVVYINGSYWGIYDLKENQNEKFYAARHDINPDLVNNIRRNTVALHGTGTQIKEVYALAKKKNLSSQANYDNFVKYVDAEAWIDYIIARSFTGDNDIFNQKLWNTSDYSARWRPVFYDCDYAFGGLPSETLSKYFTGDGVPSPDGSLTNMWIPTALKTNAAWVEKLIERYAECLNTVFCDAGKLFDKLYGELEPEIERHIKRWGNPSSVSKWNDYAMNLKRIVNGRSEVVKKQLKSYFNISDARMKELFPNG